MSLDTVEQVELDEEAMLGKTVHFGHRSLSEIIDDRPYHRVCDGSKTRRSTATNPTHCADCIEILETTRICSCGGRIPEGLGRT